MMKLFTILLLISGMILWTGCGSGGSENGELPPPEEFDWPWLKTGRTLDLPELGYADETRGGPETVMISVKAGTDQPYYFSTTNAHGIGMERAFKLRELREVLRDSREHHGQEGYHANQVLIAADKNVAGKYISDLIGAFSHINYSRFNFQVAYPEGFEANEQFYDRIPHLSLLFPLMEADGYFALRREQGADYYLTKEEIAALKKPKKEKKIDLEETSFEEIDLKDLPPPPQLELEDLPPPPRAATIGFKFVYPGSSVEKRDGAIYVRLVDGATLDVRWADGSQLKSGSKRVPLREFAQFLKDHFPNIETGTPVIMTFAPEAAWDSVVEMIRVMRELQVRKYALYTAEHEKYIEYLKTHPELEEEGLDEYEDIIEDEW